MNQAIMEKKAPPVFASIKMQVLPQVALKLALGATYAPGPEGVKVAFESDLFVLHQKDFDVCHKASLRVKEEMPKGTEMTATAFIDLFLRAQKLVSDEIFRPGTKKVIYYPSVSEGSAFYRCILPSLYLNKGDRVTSHVTVHKTAREAVWYDTVVIQIDHSKATQLFAKTLKEMGKKVVFEFDDDYAALEPWHPCYELYRHPETRESFEAMLKLADRVTVSTAYLARKYKAKTKSIHVIPNMIPLGDWPKAEPHGKDEFRILWAGSPGHFGDLEVVVSALWRFLRETKNVTVYFLGREPKEIPEDLRSRILCEPFREFEKYPIALADVRADVAIAPLSDVEFNRSKSNIKLLEYGGCGYPIIASPVGPYQAACDEAAGRAPAFLCSTEEAWYRSLCLYYGNPTVRREMAEKAVAYARRYDVEQNVKQVEEFFDGL